MAVLQPVQLFLLRANFFLGIGEWFSPAGTPTLHIGKQRRLATVTMAKTQSELVEVVSPQADSPAYELMIASPGDHQFIEACAFSREQYGRHFSCELNQFYPTMFCLYKDSTLVACCGFRSAGDEPLFLEQYLDVSIEESIRLQNDEQLPRHEIVEIGGLAMANREEGLAFMVRLAPQFQILGFQYATCTVTSPVRKLLVQVGIGSLFLATANPNCVSQADNAWGRYYALEPVVLAGAIQPAIDHMAPFLKLI